MRILFVVHQFMPEFSAGTERATLNLAKSAQRDGHHVAILTTSLLSDAPWSEDPATGLRATSIEGIPVHAIPQFDPQPMRDFGFAAQGLPAIRRHLEQGAYDLVHVMHGMRMLDVVDAVRELHIPYVITLTDFFLTCWRINLIRSSGELCAGPEAGAACIRHCSTMDIDDARILERRSRLDRVLEDASAIIACSEFVADVFRAEYPMLPIRVIEHGIDLLGFAASPPRDRSNEVTFGYIGTLSEAKGVHILADAFVRAAPPGARLELVGPSYDLTLSERLHGLARQHPQIVIEPAVPAHRIPERLGRFDILCLPSLVPETFSLALHEGFAASLPALVSDLGHPGYVLKAFGCGMAVRAGDVAAWAEAITAAVGAPGIVDAWRQAVPLPRRVEEEAFLYGQIYRASTHSGSVRQA